MFKGIVRALNSIAEEAVHQSILATKRNALLAESVQLQRDSRDRWEEEVDEKANAGNTIVEYLTALVARVQIIETALDSHTAQQRHTRSKTVSSFERDHGLDKTAEPV